MPRPRKTPTMDTPAPASILDKYKDFPGIKVLERRFEHPDLPGSLPIRLKDEPDFAADPDGSRRLWYVRWINGGIDGRFAQATDALGYVPVRLDELQNPQAIAGLHSATDGLVRRGDRGVEVLVKMPLELYNEVKRRQQARRERRAKNATLVKQDLAESAGRSLGDEAGETIHAGLQVTAYHRRKTTLADELHERSAIGDE